MRSLSQLMTYLVLIALTVALMVTCTPAHANPAPRLGHVTASAVTTHSRHRHTHADRLHRTRLATVPIHGHSPPHHDAPSFYVESVPEQCMTMAIYREARGEPEDTMAGVGYVVLNRTGHVNYPNTVCGVVTQANHDKHQRPYSCQFSWACHLPAGKIDATAYAHANRIALGVLSGAVPNPVGHALNFSELATASRVSKGNPYRKRIGHLIFTGPRMAHSRSELAMVSNASLPIPTDK